MVALRTAERVANSARNFSSECHSAQAVFTASTIRSITLRGYSDDERGQRSGVKSTEENKKS